MKTTSALAITVMAMLGLVVSVTAAWPQLTPDATVQAVELGPPTAATKPPPDRSGGEERDRSRAVARSRAVPTSASRPEPRPVRVTLGDVGIQADVRPVGVAADGQMQLPPDPAVLGWYRFGPAPGGADQGSAVLAGHLDSRKYGLGPLVRLRDVGAGDQVDVMLSDRSTLTYRVQTLIRFDQQALPEELFARSGAHRLRIITCGGDYDADAGGYQQNLVVTAVPA
jgi:hypothetical protein